MTEEKLHRLNHSSAKSGAHWNVRVLHGHMDSFPYNRGQNRMYRYECKLVGTDPSIYVHAIFKNSLEHNVKEVADTYVDGSTWKMSNVCLDAKGRGTEYISGPIKVHYVVLPDPKVQSKSAQTTSFTSLLDTNELPRQLRPPAKISDLLRATGGKVRYNVIALLSAGPTNERQPTTKGGRQKGR